MKTTLTAKQKTYLWLTVALAAWILFARKKMRMTLSDPRARRLFARHGVRLNTETRMIDGQPLHFSWTGNRSLPLLVFIHGSPQSWTFFEKYLRDDLLLEQYCLVSVDRPGFGQSGFGKARRVNEQAELLCRLFDQLAPSQPVFLVGHSLGAAVAVAMAAMRPGHIKTLVLAAGALELTDPPGAGLSKILAFPPISALVPGALRPSNQELSHLPEDLFELEHRFTEISCPVFLVHAYDDRVIAHHHSESASRLFVNSPRVKMITLPSGGHLFPVTRFKQFRDLLTSIG